MLNTLLKINHSASENDNVTGGLIISITILTLWIYAGHPFKEKDDESIKGTIHRTNIQIGFIILVFLTIICIYNAIKYFFFE